MLIPPRRSSDPIHILLRACFACHPTEGTLNSRGWNDYPHVTVAPRLHFIPDLYGSQGEITSDDDDLRAASGGARADTRPRGHVWHVGPVRIGLLVGVRIDRPLTG
jgi:hypothetical protein